MLDVAFSNVSLDEFCHVVLTTQPNTPQHRTDRYGAMTDDGSTAWLKSVVSNRSPPELHRGGNCNRRDAVGAG